MPTATNVPPGRGLTISVFTEDSFATGKDAVDKILTGARIHL
jgi:hypothetical protein